MLGGKKLAVVLPGLNVARTLERTLAAVPEGFVDDFIFVDDGSTDGSGDLARQKGCRVFRHRRNLGYGAGQKTGYREALRAGADAVVMLHPDFQYRPELVPSMASMALFGGFDLVLGSRVLLGGALRGGMPAWKFAVNRSLTWFENALMGAQLSEYHTGYRAFSRRLLETLPLTENRNDYVFDNEVIAQTLEFGLSIGELSCPARYFDEMQTITFLPGVKYGLGCLQTATALKLHRSSVQPSPMFASHGRKLEAWTEGDALGAEGPAT